MAAVATTSTSLLLPRICSSYPSTFRRSTAAGISFGHSNGVPATKSSYPAYRRGHVRASESQRDPDDPAFLSQEDLNYLVKLGAGSVVGAAVIKYGSVLFPEITRPNITQALLTIFFPVIVAVLLLVRQSRSE